MILPFWWITTLCLSYMGFTFVNYLSTLKCHLWFPSLFVLLLWALVQKCVWLKMWAIFQIRLFFASISEQSFFFFFSNMSLHLNNLFLKFLKGWFPSLSVFHLCICVQIYDWRFNNNNNNKKNQKTIKHLFIISEKIFYIKVHDWDLSNVSCLATTSE